MPIARQPPARRGELPAPPGDTAFRAFKIDVLRIEGGLIAEITTFDADAVRGVRPGADALSAEPAGTRGRIHTGGRASGSCPRTARPPSTGTTAPLT